MNTLHSFKNKVKDVTKESFDEHALELFQFQATNNLLYKRYLDLVGCSPYRVKTIDEIPFLPIQFFKHHEVVTGKWEVEQLFLSSGTTGSVRSAHKVEDVKFYQQHSLRSFKAVFEDFSEDDVLLALLPSYQAQGNSSLICMVDYLMSQVAVGKYCLEDYQSLDAEIADYLSSGKNVYLFGVGYALLDFAEHAKNKLDGLKIIETGGMKGRRAEITKEEYYSILKGALGEVTILSEYGMTELMSQAYSVDESVYFGANSLKVITREPTDPFSKLYYNKTGVLNVIDLANVHSCAFVETQDLGKVYENGGFEVLGRLDNSDVRGCNLLVQ